MPSPDSVDIRVSAGVDVDAVSKIVLDRQRLIEDVRRLSHTGVWSHNFRSALVIALQWAIIAGAAAAALTVQLWWAWAIAVVVIGTRQHALGVLVHEAAHYRLFTNKTVNDILSDLLCGFPTGIRTSVYRAYHFQHHRFVNDRTLDPDTVCVADDKDWSWPKTRGAGARLFLRDLWGLNVRGFARIVWNRWSPWAHYLRGFLQVPVTASQRCLFVAWLLAVDAVILLTHSWYEFLLLWIVPGFTVQVAIFRIRALAEHYGVEADHELNQTRTVLPAWWERLLFCPCGVNYHLEHHLFPSVPYYRLHQLHERLLQEPEFRSGAHLTTSYTGLCQELLLNRK